MVIIITSFFLRIDETKEVSSQGSRVHFAGKIIPTVDLGAQVYQ